MIILICINKRKWYQKLFSNKDHIDRYKVYYRRDNINEVFYYDSFPKNYKNMINLFGEFYYNNDNKTLIEVDNNKIFNIKDLCIDDKLVTNKYNDMYSTITKESIDDCISFGIFYFIDVFIKVEIKDIEILRRNLLKIMIDKKIKLYGEIEKTIDENTYLVKFPHYNSINFFTGEFKDNTKRIDIEYLNMIKDELCYSGILSEPYKEIINKAIEIKNRYYNEILNKIIRIKETKENSIHLFLITKVPKEKITEGKIVENSNIKIDLNESLVDLGIWEVDNNDRNKLIKENEVIDLIEKIEYGQKMFNIITIHNLSKISI